VKKLRTNYSHGFKAFLLQIELIEIGGRLGRASGKFGISSQTRYYSGLSKILWGLLMNPVSMLNMPYEISRPQSVEVT